MFRLIKLYIRAKLGYREVYLKNNITGEIFPAIIKVDEKRKTFRYEGNEYIWR